MTEEAPELTQSSVHWHDGKDTAERLSYMLSNPVETGSDLIFRVGQEWEAIHAHSFQLILHSTQFCKDLSTQSAIKKIELPEFQPKAFRSLLSYIYINEYPKFSGDEIGVRDAVELLKVCEIYMPQLSDPCRDAFLHGITQKEHFPTEALKILPRILETNDTILCDYIVELLAKSSAIVFQNPLFLKLPFKAITEILKSDDVDAREIDIFNAVCFWAEKQIVNKRNVNFPEGDAKWLEIANVLGDALFLIRFPLMTLDEFIDSGASKTVSKEDRNRIITWITTSSKVERDESYDPKPFSTKLRNSPSNNSNVNESALSTTVDETDTSSTGTATPEKRQSRTESSTTVNYEEAKKSTRVNYSPVSDEEPEPMPKRSRQENNSDDNNTPSASTFANHTGNISTFEELYNYYANMNSQALAAVTSISPENPIRISSTLIKDMVPLLMPNLAEYSVTYVYKPHEKYDQARIDFLKRHDLAHSLVFFTTSSKSSLIRLASLWKSGIKINVKVDGFKILQMDHDERSLTFSKMYKSAKSILTGLRGGPRLVKLHLYSVTSPEFSFGLIPTSHLESFVFRSTTPVDVTAMTGFLRKCKNLVELSIHSTRGFERVGRLIKLDLNFRLPNLRKLFVSLPVTISYLECSGRLEKLEELYLNTSGYAQQYLLAPDLIQATFPSLTKIFIEMSGGSRQINVDFVLALLKHSVLESIRMNAILCFPTGQQNYHLGEEKRSEILSIFGLEELPDCFDLRKQMFFGYDGNWMPVPVDLNNFKTIIFQNCKASVFFEDFSVFLREDLN